MLPHTCLIVSDFNVSNLRSHLTSGRHGPAMSVREVDYGQAVPVLMEPSHPIWTPTPDVLVIWTRPEGISAAFGDALNGLPVSEQEVLSDTSRFVELVTQRLTACRSLVMPLWTVSPYRRGMGISDWRKGGLGRLLHRMNGILIDRLADHPAVFLVSPDQWLQQQVPGTADKFWYAAKSSFPAPAYAIASENVHAAMRATGGQSRKLLLLDLDDTLWGGIVGDVGTEGLRLGGHDPVGEAFRDFQQGVQSLMRKGIAVGVVSKNEESVALQAMDSHADMMIRSSMLAGWRINWNDKAQNIIELADELNLGLDSVVFIDDNPAERGRVSEALPQVLVPNWPQDPTLYRHALERLSCFDQAQMTEEDRQRSTSYAANRQREALKTGSSGEDWVLQLGISARVEVPSSAQLARVAQLLNKTNQFNLSTRRMSEEEIRHWLSNSSRQLFVVSASDRFSDLGLIGLLSISLEDHTVDIVDLVLSCRAFGRQLENLMLAIASEVAGRSGARNLRAILKPTTKNKPTAEFMSTKSQWREEPEGSGSFVWDLAVPYPRPSFIQVSAESIDSCVLVPAA